MSISNNNKETVKSLVANSIKSYTPNMHTRLDSIKESNEKQNYMIRSLSRELTEDNMEITTEGSVVSLTGSDEGLVQISELEGNTLVNYCTDGSNTLILSDKIDLEGTFVTTVDGSDEGLVDVELDGNSIVNCYTEGSKEVALTKKVDSEGEIVNLTNTSESGVLDILCEGNTLVNHCTDGSKVIVTNPDVSEEGLSLSLDNCSQGGHLDVVCEGRTLVNLSTQKDSLAITKSYTVEGTNHVGLQGDYDGKCRPQVEGNTLVNYCTDGSKEITLNNKISSEGVNATLRDTSDNGQIDVICEGNTLVNIIDMQDWFTSPTEIGTDSTVSVGLSSCPTFKILQVKENTNYTVIPYVRYSKSTFTDPMHFYVQLNIGPKDGGLAQSWFRVHMDGFNKPHLFNTRDLVDLNSRSLFLGGCNGSVTVHHVKLVILEGDWTNKEIPSYFNGMKSVGECESNTLRISSQSKNLFNIDETDVSGSLVRFEKSGNTLRVIPTVTEGEWVSYNIRVRGLKRGRTYTLSCKSDNYHLPTWRVALYEIRSNRNVCRWDGNYYTIPDNADVDDIYLRIHCSDENASNLREVEISDILIEEAEIQTEFEPYAINTQEISLSQPLRGLPNGVRDKIVKLGDKWYVERNIYAITLDGNSSEGWEKSTYFNFATPIFTWNDTGIGICKSESYYSVMTNRFPYARNYSQTMENHKCLYVYNYGGVDDSIRVQYPLDTVEEFRNYLASNPVDVIIQLETPTYEEITDPTVLTYLDTTHISTNSTIPCDMKIQNSGYNAVIKPSTEYTVVLDTDTSESVELDLGGTNLITSNRVNVVTTPDQLTDGALKLYGKGTKVSKAQVFEGDVSSNLPRKYVDGLKNSFEDKKIPNSLTLPMTRLYSRVGSTVTGQSKVQLTNPLKSGVTYTRFIVVDKLVLGTKSRLSLYDSITYSDGTYAQYSWSLDTAGVHASAFTIGNISPETKLEYVLNPGMGDFTDSTGAEIHISDVIIVEGDWTSTPLTRQEVTDYVGKYRVNYKITGKNKFDGKAFTPKNGIISYSYTNDVLTMECRGIKHDRLDYVMPHGTLVHGKSYILTAKVEILESAEGYTPGINCGYAYYTSPSKTYYGQINHTTNIMTLKFVYDAYNKYNLIGFHNEALDGVTKLRWSQIQLEEGSVATTYQSYKEYTKTFYLNSPLLKGDTIEDRDGKATHVKRYNKLVLDGSENWRISGKVAYIHKDEIPVSIRHLYQGSLICDRFKALPGGNDPSTVGTLQLGNSWFLSTYIETTLEEFKTWLSQNPITVVYELASAIYETISDESILCDSYVNGHLDLDTNLPIKMVNFRNVNSANYCIAPSTTYVVQFESDNVGKLDRLGLGGSYYTSYDVVKGTNRLKITTLDSPRHRDLSWYGIGFNASNVQLIKDSSKNPEYIKYFEGMKSVGECEDNKVQISSASSNPNLFRNSGFLEGFSYYNTHHAPKWEIVEEPTSKSGKALKFTTRITGLNGVYQRDVVPYIEDAKYVVSGWCKSTAGSQLEIHIERHNACVVNFVDEEWVRFEYASEKHPTNWNRVITFYSRQADKTFYLKDIKIEKSDVATPYIPHESESNYKSFANTIEINLLEPLRSIGNVKDKIVKKDGKWYVERHCSRNLASKSRYSMYTETFMRGVIFQADGRLWDSWIECDKSYYAEYDPNNMIYGSFYVNPANVVFVFSPNDPRTDEELINLVRSYNILYQLDKPIYEPLDISPTVTTYSSNTHISNNSIIPCNMIGQTPTYTISAVKPNTVYTLALTNNNKTPVTASIDGVSSSSHDGVIVIQTPNVRSISSELKLTGDGTQVKDIRLLEGTFSDSRIPRYFEGIKSVGQDEENGHRIELISTNKNLFDKSKIFDSGYSFDVPTQQNNGKLGLWTTIDGNRYTTTTDAGVFNRGIGGVIKVKKNTDYTLSIDNVVISYTDTEGSGRIAVVPLYEHEVPNRLYGGNSHLIERLLAKTFKAGSKVEFTFNTGKYDYIQFYIGGLYASNPQGTLTISYENPRIECNSASTSHIETQSNIQEIMLNEPLRSLPEGVRDRFVKKDGKWYIERNCKEYYLNGNEAWVKLNIEGSSREDYPVFYYTQSTISLLHWMHCDKIPVVRDVNAGAGKFAIGSHSAANSIRICIEATKLRTNDAEGFKSWLRDNPVRVVCKLDKPIYELLEVDPNLRTYSQATNITNNSHIPCKMVVTNPSYNTIIKPSTKYSVILDTSYKTSSQTISADLGGGEATSSNNVLVVTTPTTLSHNSLKLYGSDVSVYNVRVLEGDWTSKDRPSYFEGIKSVGDLKDNKVEILSQNKNYFTGEARYELSDVRSLSIANQVKGLIGKTTRKLTFKADVTTIDHVGIEGQSPHWGLDICFICTDGSERWSNFTRGNDNGLHGLGPNDTKRRFVWVKDFEKEVTIRDMKTCNIFTRGTTGTFIMENVEIILGEDSSDTYLPHTSNKTVITLSEPLRSLPNGIKDRLVKIHDQWYVERNLEEKVLTGDDFRTMYADEHTHADNVAMYTAENLYKGHGRGDINIICDKLPTVDRDILKTCNYTAIMRGTSYITLTVRRDQLESISTTSFRKYVDSLNLRCVHTIAPKYEPLSVSPTVNVFSDKTHISTNSVVPCTMRVKNTGYSTVIKSNTTYTIAFDTETSRTETTGVNLGGTEITTLSNTITLRTPPTLSDHSLRLYGKGKTSKVRVLEGDKTNWIPSHFEGIKSCFETKLQDDGTYKMEILSNNKNLCNNGSNYENWTVPGSNRQYDKIKNGFILDNSISRIAHNRKVKLVNGQVYTVSLDVKFLQTSSHNRVQVYMCNNSNKDVYGSNRATDGKLMWTFTYDETKPILGVYFHVNHETEHLRAEITNIQIEEGRTATEYIENTSNKTELSLMEPLRGSDDLKDRLVIKDGKLMIERRFSQIRLDGTTKYPIHDGKNMYIDKYSNSPAKGEFSTTSFVIGNIPNKINEWDKSLISGFTRHAYSGAFDGTVAKPRMFSDHPDLPNIYICIGNDNTLTVDDFYEFLSKEPIDIVYKLKEPVYEEVPYELQEILLEGYEDGTLLLDTNIPPTSVVKYKGQPPIVKQVARNQARIMNNTTEINEVMIPYIMDMDYRLVCMQLSLGSPTDSVSALRLFSNTYDMLKRDIESHRYSKSEYTTRLQAYLTSGKISPDEYNKLEVMLNE